MNCLVDFFMGKKKWLLVLGQSTNHSTNSNMLITNLDP